MPVYGLHHPGNRHLRCHSGWLCSCFVERRGNTFDQVQHGWGANVNVNPVRRRISHHVLAVDHCWWHIPHRFHEIEPQMGVMELLQPTRLARKVLATPRSTVPYPLLKENTLVLSDQLVLRRRRGRLELQVRVGDVYPNQVPQISMRRAPSL